MDLVYQPVVRIIIGAHRAMGWRVAISGAEHIPRAGSAVIASNHVGYLDFTFLGYGPRERGRLIRFLAKSEVFRHPIAGPLMRGMRHIPVDRSGRAQEAMAASLDALRRGEVIGLFPEGTISRSFVPAAARSGAARLAMQAGAPLVPAAVWGSQRLLTKGRPRNLQRGVAISVRYGEPVAYAPGEDAAEVTARLMDRIGELVDAAARDYPQRPAGDADRWWLPAHLGGTAPTPEQVAQDAVRERAERREQRRRDGRAGHAE
ncbi:MAG TPA: lysophospholipid acyltransferase family protein [Egibacteraceae bacterium]|nr:lysophospholipid acyltransferase family protein [Egibacteraceae bacterium]